jgi:sugar phosphate isomerase/epimerase
LIAWAPGVGTDVVTVCTGSRDPESMWRKHPDNDTPEAWADLLVQIERAVQVAEEYGVTLGVEPEIGNTINSVHKARRLLDEVRSPQLKIVMDGANIFQRGQLPNMRKVLDEAFDPVPTLLWHTRKILIRMGRLGIWRPDGGGWIINTT